MLNLSVFISIEQALRPMHAQFVFFVNAYVCAFIPNGNEVGILGPGGFSEAAANNSRPRHFSKSEASHAAQRG
jgi:hypothetical protein